MAVISCRFAVVACIVGCVLLAKQTSAVLDTLIPQAHSMILVVGNEQRCVYANAAVANERVFFQFQVRSGSSDFTLTIEGPGGEAVFQSESGEHHHEDRLYFHTKSAGEHAFCIDNSGRGREEKVIRMSVAMMSVKKLRRKMDPLLKTMAKADASLIALTEDQAYLRAREVDHRVTIESNNTRMLVRWLVEISVMLALSYGQYAVLKKMLSSKMERAA